MAKNFLDQDDQSSRLSFRDGFVFGFGFLIANLLGLSVLGVLVMAVNSLLR